MSFLLTHKTGLESATSTQKEVSRKLVLLSVEKLLYLEFYVALPSGRSGDEL